MPPKARQIKAGAAYVEILTRDSKFVRGLARAGKQLRSFGAGIRNVGFQVAAVGAAINGLAAAAVNQFSKMGDKLDKMSHRTGIGVETLSELSWAAQIAGTEVGALEKAVGAMQRTIRDASRGLETKKYALDQLNLSYEQLKNLSVEDQFKIIAGRLGTMTDKTMRGALAMEIFGKSGRMLIPMLEKGAQGIEALQAEARRLGLTISEEDTTAAAEFTDKLTTLWAVVNRGVFAIGAGIVEPIQNAVVALTEVLVKVNKWIDRNRELFRMILLVGGIILGLGVALITLGTVINLVGWALSGIVAAFSAFGTVVSGIAVILGAVASPIGLIIAGLGALVAYVGTVTGAWKKAIDWLGGAFDWLGDRLGDTIKGMMDALSAGDLSLAAKVLWLGLKVTWLEGTESLRKIWSDWKFILLHVFEDLRAGVIKGMLDLYYGIQGIWQRIVLETKMGFEDSVNWTTKAILFAKYKAGQLTKEQYENAVEGAEHTSQYKKGLIAGENQEALAELGQKWIAAQEGADSTSKARHLELGLAQQRAEADAESELANAQLDLDHALYLANKAKNRALANAPAGADAPPELDDLLDSLTKKVIGIRGTFSAAGVAGLSHGQDPNAETAKNTRQMRKDIHHIRNQSVYGGSRFA